MVSEKTPPHKRIVRAEKSREEWKSKALERRVIAEKLKLDLELKDTRIHFFEQQNQELKNRLATAESKINIHEKTIESLKKNSSK